MSFALNTSCPSDEATPLTFAQRLAAALKKEWKYLSALQRSDRRWPFPVMAALASGLPVLLGVWLGQLGWGLIGSLGGMVFLYTPNTAMHHRMVVLMACAFGLVASYTLGVASHVLPIGKVPTITAVAIVSTMLVRLYRLGPPGSVFFIMAAAIAAYTPATAAELPQRTGLIFLGALQACLLALLYSAVSLWRRDSPPPAAPAPATFDVVVLDAVIIGLAVGLALALAELLRLDRPFWAPVACAAVVQGATFRAVWNKQLQRLVGTCGGLLLAWALLTLPLGPWGRAALMMALSFCIEVAIVRHYALGAVFFTPLALFLADGAHTAAPVAPLITARMVDTVVGSLVGMLGGLVIHHAGSRALLRRLIGALLPRRWARRVDPPA